MNTTTPETPEDRDWFFGTTNPDTAAGGYMQPDPDVVDDVEVLARELETRISGTWSISLLRGVAEIVLESRWLASHDSLLTHSTARSVNDVRDAFALQGESKTYERTQLAGYEVGADFTEPADGSIPSPGQLYARLLSRPDARIAMLSGVMDQANRGEECFRLDHEQRITSLTGSLDRVSGLLDANAGIAAAIAGTRLDIAALAKRVKAATKRKGKK